MAGEDQATETQEAPSWDTGLSEEHRGSTLYKRFQGKSIDDLFSQHIAVEKRVGVNRIEKPSEQWDDGKWNQFYKDIGRPDTIDGYQFDDLPDTIKDSWNIENEKKIIETAHKEGLTAKQMKALRSTMAQMVADETTSAQNEWKLETEKHNAALKSEWGSEYETRIAQAKRALQFNDPKGEAFSLLQNAGIAQHPAILRMMAQVDAATRGEPGRMPQGTQPAVNIDDQISEIMNRPAYFDNTHPDHMKTRNMVGELYKLMAQQGKA